MNTKLLKMLIVLSMIVVVAGGLTRLVRGNSMSLTEYERLNGNGSGQEGSAGGNSGTGSTAPSGDSGTAGSLAPSGDSGTAGSLAPSGDSGTAGSSTPSGASGSTGSETPSGVSGSTGSETPSGVSGSAGSLAPSGASGSAGSLAPSADLPQGDAALLTGAALNGDTQAGQRVSLTEDFYYEPLSDNLRRYITGVSYPAVSTEEEAAALVVGYDDLRYVHVLHYDFEGNPTEGELICNEYIAQDLVEIFYELYYNEYQLERMVLIDEYDGDDTASMEDNNTSCFNYRVVEGSESLSKHAYGLAIDVNPFYNPYVTYDKDGTERVSPAAALEYADRSAGFPYKIDEEDLCCRLFKEHGFIWGGNWNSLKDYQHFQKTPK